MIRRELGRLCRFSASRDGVDVQLEAEHTGRVGGTVVDLDLERIDGARNLGPNEERRASEDGGNEELSRSQLSGALAALPRGPFVGGLAHGSEAGLGRNPGAQTSSISPRRYSDRALSGSSARQFFALAAGLEAWIQSHAAIDVECGSRDVAAWSA